MPSGARRAVERPTPTRIAIIVADKNRLVPVLRRALPDAENGRGLAVVDALSARWGYDRLPWGNTYGPYWRSRPESHDGPAGRSGGPS